MPFISKISKIGELPSHPFFDRRVCGLVVGITFPQTSNRPYILHLTDFTKNTSTNITQSEIFRDESRDGIPNEFLHHSRNKQWHNCNEGEDEDKKNIEIMRNTTIDIYMFDKEFKLFIEICRESNYDILKELDLKNGKIFKNFLIFSCVLKGKLYNNNFEFKSDITSRFSYQVLIINELKLKLNKNENFLDILKINKFILIDLLKTIKFTLPFYSSMNYNNLYLLSTFNQLDKINSVNNFNNNNKIEIKSNQKYTVNELTNGLMNNKSNDTIRGNKRLRDDEGNIESMSVTNKINKISNIPQDELDKDIEFSSDDEINNNNNNGNRSNGNNGITQTIDFDSIRVKNEDEQQNISSNGSIQYSDSIEILKMRQERTVIKNEEQNDYSRLQFQQDEEEHEDDEEADLIKVDDGVISLNYLFNFSISKLDVESPINRPFLIYVKIISISPNICKISRDNNNSDNNMPVENIELILSDARSKAKYKGDKDSDRKLRVLVLSKDILRFLQINDYNKNGDEVLESLINKSILNLINKSINKSRYLLIKPFFIKIGKSRFKLGWRWTDIGINEYL
ncbi:hypothetical protein B5S29_g631 [[Candida] boidinii]|nr:hypothetical protein B5S29_g631 [[Candida] boidinii]